MVFGHSDCDDVATSSTTKRSLLDCSLFQCRYTKSLYVPYRMHQHHHQHLHQPRFQRPYTTIYAETSSSSSSSSIPEETSTNGDDGPKDRNNKNGTRIHKNDTSIPLQSFHNNIDDDDDGAMIVTDYNFQQQETTTTESEY